MDDEDMGEADVPLPAQLRHGAAGHKLLLAGRHALPSLHPLDEGGVSIPNGSSGELDVRRPVTPHAGLGQPGHTDLQTPCCFFGS